MLVRNTIVSTGCFLFDIALLCAMVQIGGMAKIPAAAIGFVAANSVHYAFGRTWIFHGTDRAVASGYFYFLVNAIVGLVVTVTLFALMLRFTAINYIVARILVSAVAGLAVFLLNAMLNFRRL